jgi:hypothetical protein
MFDGGEEPLGLTRRDMKRMAFELFINLVLLIYF